jgi:hypothetical protein
MASWVSWIWGTKPPGPARATDAAHDPTVRGAFLQMLDNTEPPQVFKASEVAQLLTDKQLAALGYEKWRDLIPAIKELAWELRELGYCDILQKGKLLGPDVELMEVEGPVRFRRREGQASRLTDDW